MRILFVGMSDSVHTARWINQLKGQGWGIHLFPSVDVGLTHPDLRGVMVYHSFYARPPDSGQRICDGTVKLRGIPVVLPYAHHAAYALREGLKITWPNHRVLQLSRLVRRVRPDIVHSMEIQSAGYLTLAAKQQCGGRFPPWIVTNWGSDIYLFGRLSEHVEKIKSVLAACDYYSCECQRDVGLARKMGFEGEVLPVLPNAGGLDLPHVMEIRQRGPTSSRRLILLKGYQHWAGRALVGLRAIEMCARELTGYRVAIYSASNDVRIAAELVSKSAGIPIECIPFCSHEEMLGWYGRARVYVGLSISDAIPTSLLEAMVMGAFPILSNTGAADEWVTDGDTGMIVPPEDPEVVAAAIRRAVSDDALVDHASQVNSRVARDRLDENLIRPQVIATYERIGSQVTGKRSRGEPVR